MFRKKAIIGIFIFGVLLSAGGYWFLKGNSLLLQLGNHSKLEISSPFTKVKEIDKTTEKIAGSKEISRTYVLVRFGMRVGYINITTRQLPNGDFFLFHKLRALENKSIETNSSLIVNNPQKVDLIPWNETEVSHTHHKNFGTDPTTNPVGRYTFQTKSEEIQLVQGKTFLTTEMKKEYDTGNESIIRELVREQNASSLSKGHSLNIKLRAEDNEISETWSIVSEKGFFRSSVEEKEWIQTLSEKKTETNNWYTSEGPYNKLPWSIEPYTKMGYGRNLGDMQEETALTLYKDKDERFFQDLVYNSLVDLEKYRSKKHTSLWPTEYTSTWLKKAYNTTAPYYDTRHNEFISYFLDEAYQALDIKQPDNSIIQYADFLIEQTENGKIINTENGHLLTDYFKEGSAIKTHASLNHELGGIKILLHSFLSSGNEEYLFQSQQLLKGIEDLGTDWIRENGDLWYQVNPDLTFTGNDYEQLTLIDLLETRELLKEVNHFSYPILDGLIDSKLDYLNSKNIEYHPKVKELLE
ncbi:hypothetical protein CN378_10765 [Bacillus sp. AFS015802]|uniref:hypothetical protein n=1 Tax=Bacillus sp. AFS015802 TaxID=2033486 RepID=UPI000BF8A3D3|nr:hypothetical protein [Bacillus sp. AFS015802]PFA67321.1 hypothetical protein CN378_10765 [Bacillus sp. AFS015802]